VGAFALQRRGEFNPPVIGDVVLVMGRRRSRGHLAPGGQKNGPSAGPHPADAGMLLQFVDVKRPVLTNVVGVLLFLLDQFISTRLCSTLLPQLFALRTIEM
jgi:hypothetical protein